MNDHAPMLEYFDIHGRPLSREPLDDSRGAEAAFDQAARAAPLAADAFEVWSERGQERLTWAFFQRGRPGMGPGPWDRHGAGWVRATPSALRLMPDYGGAWAWDFWGLNIDPGPEDFPKATQGDFEHFERRAKTWQLRFEVEVDDDPPSAGLPAFDWGAFDSASRALALRARALTPMAVFLRKAWESPGGGDPKSRERPVVWGALPGPLEFEACQALERLDEKGFVQALGRGARQSSSPAMPWGAYCAHFELEDALAALAAACPGALSERGVDGRDAARAAFFSSSLGCLRLALSRAPWSGPRGDELCAAAASMARTVGAKPAVEVLKALEQAGVALDGGSRFDPSGLGKAADEVWFWSRARILEGAAAPASLRSGAKRV